MGNFEFSLCALKDLSPKNIIYKFYCGGFLHVEFSTIQKTIANKHVHFLYLEG